MERDTLMAIMSPEVARPESPRGTRALDELEYKLSSLLGYTCLGLCAVGLGFLVF